MTSVIAAPVMEALERRGEPHATYTISFINNFVKGPGPQQQRLVRSTDGKTGKKPNHTNALV